MMLRELLSIALLAGIILIISLGCAVEATGDMLSFTLTQPDQLPKAIDAFLEENKHYETVAVFEDAHYTYFVVNRGVMPTDGYDVNITNIYKTNNDHVATIRVEVEYINPTINQEINNTLTYPYCVAKTNAMDLSGYIIEFYEDERLIASIDQNDIIHLK
ncbi:MAG: hypothetical protein PWQ93_1657 [Clostridiales bacterium]|nr:hypothetical protein [Clostridiales bacterium]